MDKEQARFILRSFRPDGADAQNPDFAEALSLAASDRELGDWLARERAEDASFAKALQGIEIPEDLRQAICDVLDQPAGEIERDSLDNGIAGALTSITPPAELRSQILNAMALETNETSRKVVPFSLQKRWLSGLAAAAAIVLGLFLALGPGTTNAVASISPPEVQQSVLSYFQAPDFTLDLRNEEQSDLFRWLQAKELPTPDALPPGLQNLSGIGCRELRLGKKSVPASLICFKPSDGGSTIHLVILKKDLVDSALPTSTDARKKCHGCHKSGWATTRWSDREHAYFLFGKRDPTQLATLF
ncbi:MAG: hypothetical protein ACQKBY_05480 [Verrucomicrobiales bacterium]